ncbi:MAG: lipocalin-like domain-containing protein [Terriglobales bacterium]
MKPLALLLLLLAPAAALGPAPTSPFRIATPGYAWHFPQDDFAHPNFASEWWYFTGNLHSATGRQFGFELTFFRISPEPGTDLEHQLYFTHFSITDAAGHGFDFDTRARRGNWAQAGVEHTAPGFRLWNENWYADFDASGPRHLHAAWGGLSLDLAVTPGARMLNGVNGWSQKGSGNGEASYYSSFPHLAVRGMVQGTAVTGLAWMDHEFATDQLAPNQQGWDWMGLHLPTGDLMLYNLRLTSGARDPHSAGTWRPLGGAPVHLVAADFTLAPTRWWHSYPVAWRVGIPRLGLAFQVTPVLDDQEIRAPAIGVNYWEGAVTLSNGGEGYLELTGYGKRFGLLQ